MRGSNRIYHKPYIPANRSKEANLPYICRIAPYETGFEFEWISAGDSEHKVYYRERSSDVYKSIAIKSNVVTLDGLDADTHYEFYVEDGDGLRSNTRYVRTGRIPDGTSVINYLHPDDNQYDFSGKYLCSPSLIRLEDDSLVAGMDLYGPSMAQTLTILYKSFDNGKTWQYLTDLHPFYWGSLFLHKGKMYMLGLTTEYGNLQITCSEDGGNTWAVPVTIFYGSNVLCLNGGVHRAPMQVINHAGRLYTTCEYGSWNSGGHLPSVISIDENDDLMVPENWTSTGYLPYEGLWKAEGGKQGDTMEGNLVIAPDGNMYSYMRWKIGEYLRLKIDLNDPEVLQEYAGIHKAPVTNSMFRIIPYKGKYLFITNRVGEQSGKHDCWTYRNILSLYVTEDMKNFRLIKDIINYDHIHPAHAGFQYPALIKDDDGICLCIRSAFNEPCDCHNSNYMLFTKVTDEEITANF